MESKQILTIGLGSFIGAIVFGLANSSWWHFMISHYSENTDLILGLGKDFNSKIGLVFGLVFGVVCGFIIGMLIINFQTNIILSFTLGLLINGLLPLLAITFFAGDGIIDILGGFRDYSKDLKYIMFGQFIVGGILGVLMFLISGLEIFNFSDKPM